MRSNRIEECYREHGEALVRFAATVVGPVEAEDAVSRVIGRMLGRDDDVKLLLPYLYRAVLNECRITWRSDSRRRRREGRYPGLGDYEDLEIFPEVLAALATLSMQQRAIVHLTYWEDLAPPEVASRLNVSDGAVRKQLARSRSRLREVLRDVK